MEHIRNVIDEFLRQVHATMMDSIGYLVEIYDLYRRAHVSPPAPSLLEEGSGLPAKR